ncbi:MAG: hypothetical protein R3362_13495, partial [Rhodothermales bacterium]|nr:hypothetical protein [Rhodothermales bacterium]
MKKSHSIPSALGVSVTAETIEAVLLRRSGERTEVVQRFVRQRVVQGQFASTKDLALAVPGLKGADDADYTLEVGDGSPGGGASLLPSELANLGARTGGAPGAGVKGPSLSAAQALRPPFAAQLKDILQECRVLGVDHPHVAFCIAPPDVAYVQLPVPTEDKAKGKPRGDEAGFTAAERKRLLHALEQHHNGPVDPERVAFLPLDAVRDQRHALALVADPNEPVSATLASLRAQRTAFAPQSRFLDAEVSVYAALLAHTLRPDAEEQSAVVRVGTEDTLVLFFTGTRLRHVERLRSLSAFDAPETVCSRVLLQQDEKRIGRLHNVFVAGAGRSDHLLDAFRSYYSDAAVEPMQRVLTDSGLVLPENDDTYTKAQVLPALAVGLRLLEGWDTAADVNLLPRDLQRRRRDFELAWHTVVALVILAGAITLTVVRFQTTADEIETVREEFRLNPVTYPEQNP